MKQLAVILSFRVQLSTEPALSSNDLILSLSSLIVHTNQSKFPKFHFHFNILYTAARYGSVAFQLNLGSCLCIHPTYFLIEPRDQTV